MWSENNSPLPLQPRAHRHHPPSPMLSQTMRINLCKYRRLIKWLRWVPLLFQVLSVVLKARQRESLKRLSNEGEPVGHSLPHSPDYVEMRKRAAEQRQVVLCWYPAFGWEQFRSNQSGNGSDPFSSCSVRWVFLYFPAGNQWPQWDQWFPVTKWREMKKESFQYLRVVSH